MRLPGITYDSNRTFSLFQRLQLFLFPPVIALTIRALFCTCHIETRSAEHLHETLKDFGRTLVGIWHETMISACWANQGSNYHTLTSHSFDGELAARVVRRFGIEAVRGSSSRGGSEALQSLETAAKLVAQVGFTLDGPRGPRRVAKSGIAVLSARTQLPVVPLAIVPVRAKRLNTWDRLPVPRPFSRIVCAYGPPIPPIHSADPDSVEQMRLTVETALNSLQEEIEAEFGVDIG